MQLKQQREPGAFLRREAMEETGQPSSIHPTSTTHSPSGALYDPAIPALPYLSLVGREEELTRLRQRLHGKGDAALTALNGLPGVGKTALAMTLAHDSDLRNHFQDGILWAGLGPTPTLQSHLSRWGTLLGLSHAEMSTLKDSVDWAVALRRAIGLRAILLVIDDAWTLSDALALQVGGPNCAHLITTRFPPIAAEITVEGATTIEELGDDEGMTLLHQLAPEVVKSDLQRARELVTAVGGLPLALTLIGNYLRTQSLADQDRRLAATLQRLNNAGERLNISEPRGPLEHHPSLASTPVISLRTVIAVTDQQLAEPTRRAFHALSVFPPRPNSFSEEAALSVGACTVETLDALSDAGLLEINSAGRYTLHQTIADYASLQRTDSRPKSRLIASFAIAPFLLARGLYPIADIYLQRAYNAALITANQQSLATVLLHLGEMTWRRGDYEQAEKHLQEGLAYARKVNDRECMCAILANLGSISWKRGEYEQAHAYLQEGLMLARELQNLERMCELFQVLGSVEKMQGNYAQAEVSLQEGLKLARHIKEKDLTCPILLTLGLVAEEQGDYEQATVYLQEGLVLARQLHHSEWISGFLNNLGDVASEQENYEQAIAYFQEGLELARRIEHREWVSFLLLNLGLTTDKQKNYSLSEHYFQESLALARQIGIPQITCHALYGYGNLHLDQQLSDQAEKHFREILVLAPEGGHDFIALAQYGLARVAASHGRWEEARALGEKSVHILEDIGKREVQEVRKWLCALPRTMEKQ